MVSYINPVWKNKVPSRDHHVTLFFVSACNAGQETDIADLPPEALQSLRMSSNIWKHGHSDFYPPWN